MKKEYQEALLEEYKLSGQKPISCYLGEEEVIVPQSYHGDKEAFIDDLFSFQDEYYKEYDKYNQKHPDAKIAEPASIRAGDVYIFPPLDIALKSKNITKDATEKVVATAMRKYRATIKKTLRARKEYPNSNFAISVSDQNIKKLNALHYHYCIEKTKDATKYCLTKAGKFALSSSKWGLKQGANMVAGAVLALPLVSHYLLDKKLKFSKKSKASKFIDKTALPYIRKGALKAAILATVIFGGKKLMDSQFVEDTPKDKIENIDKIDNKVINNSSAPKYKVTDYASFKQLYEASFPLAFQSMLPTEIYVSTPYSDNGTISNTVGAGLYWYPKNGNPKSSEWIKTKDYVKLHPKLEVSGSDAEKLSDGWCRHREDGRVYRAIRNRLQGVELADHEFAAILTCAYNDETNGLKLCDFVRKNYKDPIKCAKFLVSLKPGNADFNDGIAKRHLHEALLYLNYDGYAEKQGSMLVKKGINSKGHTYHVSSVTQLNSNEVREAIDLWVNHDNFNGIAECHRKIMNYVCKGGKTCAQIAAENGMTCFGDIHFEDAVKLTKSDEMYAQAIKHYEAKDYDKALQGFKAMVDAGYDGADLHNDLAITYYHLGEYQNCIDECRLVLKTGETEQYAPANFNAGMAYEKMGNNSKAMENYKLASQREPDNKTYKNALQRTRNIDSQMKNIPAKQKQR